ncbi:hypothetical protein ACLX1H_006497 [Fusarium chlamydosporum]
MASHLVRSFMITAVLYPLANAGPCRPSSRSTFLATTTTIESDTATSTAAAGTETTTQSLTQSIFSTVTSATRSNDISESLSTTLTTFSLSTDASETSQTETSSTDATSGTFGSSSVGTTDTTLTLQSSETTGTTDIGSETSAGTASTFASDESTTTATAIESETEISITATESSSTTTTEASTSTKTQESSETTEASSSTTGSGTTTAESTTTKSEASTTTTEATTTEATTTEATTTTTEPVPTCVDYVKNPLPEDKVCGSKGPMSAASDNFKYLGNGPAGSRFDCYKACMEKPNCGTFVYQENSFCELYRGTVQETTGDDWGYEWFVPDCFCDTGIEPAPVCEDTAPIINPDWETGKFSPWDYYSRAEGRAVVDFNIVRGGQGGSVYRFQTGNFYADKSMWIYQDIKACPGITFDCTFMWWWDEYYAIPQDEDGDGNKDYDLVPYVRFYQDDDARALVSEYPRSQADTKQWKRSSSFSFTIPDSGETRVWYVASSPQARRVNTTPNAQRPTWVQQPNALALDSLVCNPRVSDTDDQSINASDPGTTFGFTTSDVAPTEARTDSEGPSSGPITGSLSESTDTPSVPATDITSSALATSTRIVEPAGRSVIFLVQASSNQKRDIKRREIGGFVGGANPDVCTFALPFTLGEGQLFVNGLPTFYAGEDYKALGIQDESSFVQGAITKGFGTSDRTLVFKNSGLPNGDAGFCQDSSGQVYITFTASPPGCVPVTLDVYQGENAHTFTILKANLNAVTQCQNGRLMGFETSTSALTITTEASTAETVSSRIFSSREPTIAETAASTEVNSISSTGPIGTFSKTSRSEAFTTTASQIVDISALASSSMLPSMSSTVSSLSDNEESSTVSSQAISSSASTFGFGASTTVSSQIFDASTSLTQTFGFVTPTIISSEIAESSVTFESSILSSGSITETSSSTEQEESSMRTTTSNETTDTTSAALSTTSGSTSDTSSEVASSAGLETSLSTEETTPNTATNLESSIEITTTTTEGSTTTTELTTTTTTAAPQSECQSANSPYTVQGVDFNLSCDTVITGGNSVGVAPATDFNQCVYFCAVFSSCVAVQYERATGSCTGFSAYSGTSAKSNFDAAIRS